MNSKYWTLPAEWYPQSGIQLTWPHQGTDWAPYLQDITEVFLQMADIISRYETVLIVTPDVESVKEILSARLGDSQRSRLLFVSCPTNDTWARDHAPLTLVSEDAASSAGECRCRVLDFRFNGWGDKFPSDWDNAITKAVFQQGLYQAEYEDDWDFVLEGGSVESDGHGTVFTTSQCLLAPHRNQPLTREDLDRELRRRLYASRVVWLDHGNLVGDDTDGHIDTIVRVAPDDTLLYVGCDDPSDSQYEDFRQLERQLMDIRTGEGRLYHLIKLPMPDAIYDDGERLTSSPGEGAERLPATYANFVILNGAVICPTYHQPDNDRKAMEILEAAFPGRQVLGIDARPVIRQHGSLHCLTMQYPSCCLRMPSLREG